MTFVTKPFLPPFQEIQPLLERIWESGTLSNSGPLHEELEAKLSDFLGVPHVSLFCNATIALMAAQKALDVQGEVITTPYSFVATSHVIGWMQNRPVFVDVEPDSLCMDPGKIEAAITEKTSAIMPLHCYGNTCDVERIADVAQRYNLKVIYDACHSFGVEDDGGSALRHGDISVVSFHATKVFNTFEGGLLVSHSKEAKTRVDHFKNFGFVDEVTVIEPGINGKMSEFNAAVGILQLQHFEGVLQRRAVADGLYRELLSAVPGIRCLEPVRQKKQNYSYLPIFVETPYPLTRDALYALLQENGVYGRRYFYPLITDFPVYSDLPSASHLKLPVAAAASQSVICLPLYPDLPHAEIRRICEIIRGAA